MKTQSELFEVFDQIRADIDHMVPECRTLCTWDDTPNVERLHIGWRNPFILATWGVGW